MGESGKEPVEELAADVVEDGGINEEFKLRVIHSVISNTYGCAVGVLVWSGQTGPGVCRWWALVRGPTLLQPRDLDSIFCAKEP